MTENEPDAGPYRTPANVEASETRSGLWPALGIAIGVIATVGFLIAQLFARHIFLEFDVSLPMLTIVILHPMAPFAAVVLLFAAILRMAISDDDSQRRRMGIMLTIIGGLAIAAQLIGILGPMNALMQALS